MSFTQSQVAALVERMVANGFMSVADFKGDDVKYSVTSPEQFSTTEYNTDQKRIQAAIDALQITGGIVKLAALTYTVDNLVKPNNVCIEGVSFTTTIIQQNKDAVGSVIQDYPAVGSSTAVGGKCWMRNFMIKGQLAGVAKANANLTAGSNSLASVDSFTGLATGYIVEGVGIPDWTTCTAFNSGAGTITLSANVMAGLTKNAQKILYRKAFTVTATHDTTSKVLAVTSGSLANIEPGMLVHSANVDYDVDSGDDSTHVTAVSVANNTITLDRKPLINGSVTVTCYVANEGIHVPEPDYNPDKDAGKEYRAPTLENVIVTQMSGDGLCVRTGRDQLIVQSGKFTSSYGCNVKMVSSNDSKIYGGIGMGSGWKGNLKIVSCSTPRLINFDCFDESMPEKYAGISIIETRQCTISSGEVNGTVYIKGKTHAIEPNHGLRFSHVNWKWHSGILNPDGTSPQYIKIRNGADVSISNCYFYADKADNSCPNYLVDVAESSTLDIHRFRLITNVATPERPFKTGIINNSDATGIVAGEYVDVSTGFVVRFHTSAGKTDGVDVPAGGIGESKKVSVASPGTALTTATIANLGSMTLEAGDWDFWGHAHFVLTGATVTKLEVGFPGNSATIPNGADQKAIFSVPVTTLTGEITVMVPPFKIAQAAQTTQRFNVRATFSAGTVSAYGTSNARRRA
jgi:hypothetical protein